MQPIEPRSPATACLRSAGRHNGPGRATARSSRPHGRHLLFAGTSIAIAVGAVSGWAAKGAAKAEMDPDWEHAPSARYASLEPEACLAELRSRSIAFERVDEAPGVVTPVRIVDGVGGVVYRTALPRERRVSSPHDVFDCRLVLALDDLSAILRRHGIDEVLMFSAWRPPPKSWPKDKPAPRHPGAMAIDVFRFAQWVSPPAPPAATSSAAPAGTDDAGPPPAEPPNKQPKAGEQGAKDRADDGHEAKADAQAQADGAESAEEKKQRVWLDVKQQFDGKIGAVTCGPKAETSNLSAEARLLRDIVCEAGQARLFTTILTPNYNRDHHNHVHMDLVPEARWRLVR